MRQVGQDPVYYRISNSTHIAQEPVKRLLSHRKNKNGLSSYLAEKFLDHAMKTNLRVFVAWGCPCRATHQNVNHLQSNQEEADTKMFLHALDATVNGVTELHIHSPDTYILVLPVRRYLDPCEDRVCRWYGDNLRGIG